MNKLHIISIVLIILIALLIINYNNADKYDLNNIKQVCLKETCFQVEIANTPILRQQGLMYREQLDSNKGMLFIFDEEGIHPFWMKNTLIPLDIIWLDENKEVVYIENNAQPCKEETCNSYNPNAKARYVLEINAGLSDEFNITLGNKLDFMI
ncbi:MAG: DUF192 domain-containing protein [Nanoarchaeota archaeon]